MGHVRIMELKEKYDLDTILEMSRILKRNDPKLVKVVEELGEDASSGKSALVIETIPLKNFFLRNYDGIEHVQILDKK